MTSEDLKHFITEAKRYLQDAHYEAEAAHDTPDVEDYMDGAQYAIMQETEALIKLADDLLNADWQQKRDVSVLASRLASELQRIPRPNRLHDRCALSFESELVDQLRLSRLPPLNRDPNPSEKARTLFLVHLRAERFCSDSGGSWLEWVIDL